MKLYNLKEATFLINNYAKIMVGNLLEQSTGSKVVRLFMEDYSNGQYRVNGEGSLVRGIIKPKRSIDLIAETQGLPSPDTVLKVLNRD